MQVEKLFKAIDQLDDDVVVDEYSPEESRKSKAQMSGSEKNSSFTESGKKISDIRSVDCPAVDMFAHDDLPDLEVSFEFVPFLLILGSVS